MYHLALHMGSTMDHMALDWIRIELQKMVALTQRIMHAVNFRGDEGYLLPRHPSSSTSCASTSASYQALSSSTRPPFAPTASAPYLPQLTAFYVTSTYFLLLVILFRDTTTYFIGP
jgi:hypothetical protein